VTTISLNTSLLKDNSDPFSSNTKCNLYFARMWGHLQLLPVAPSRWISTVPPLHHRLLFPHSKQFNFRGPSCRQTLRSL